MIKLKTDVFAASQNPLALPDEDSFIANIVNASIVGKNADGEVVDWGKIFVYNPWGSRGQHGFAFEEHFAELINIARNRTSG